MFIQAVGSTQARKTEAREIPLPEPSLTSLHYHPLEECQDSFRPWHGVQSRMSAPPSAVGQFSPTQALNLRGTSVADEETV